MHKMRHRSARGLSQYIHVLLCVSNRYHRIVVTESVAESVKKTCAGIELRYDWIRFLEIGEDKGHARLLIQLTSDL